VFEFLRIISRSQPSFAAQGHDGSAGFRIAGHASEAFSAGA
jgi:hypothetical protein